MSTTTDPSRKPSETSPTGGGLASSALFAIGERLRDDLKENTHYTAEPMFCIQSLHRETGYDSSYADNRCWWNAELMEVVYDDDNDQQKQDLEFKLDEDGDPPEGWEGPFGYKDRWETVMVALTQEGLDNYMRQDGHNVKRAAFRGQTRTYVESFHRCREMIDLRAALIDLANANVQRPADATPNTVE